jgi:hypothetical protein
MIYEPLRNVLNESFVLFIISEIIIIIIIIILLYFFIYDRNFNLNSHTYIF